MRILLLPLALLACTPAPASKVDVASLTACSELERPGDLSPAECKLTVGDTTARVAYEEVAHDATGGTVRIDVLKPDGTVGQTFSETNVSEYLSPSVEDVDGDGRADILIALASGNVNTEHAVWLYNGDASAYRRAGEVSGVEFSRTSDGYLAVPARSSAAAWNVAFYRIGETLEPLVTINVEATDVTDDGRVLKSECSIESSPGLASLHMTADEAKAKFCGEPQAGVFQ